MQPEDPDYDKIRTIVREASERYGIERVHMFGSRARGDNRPDSNYDFCYRTKKGTGLFALGGFWGELDERLPHEVYLANECRMSDGFRETVEHDLVLIYESPECAGIPFGEKS